MLSSYVVVVVVMLSIGSILNLFTLFFGNDENHWYFGDDIVRHSFPFFLRDKQFLGIYTVSFAMPQINIWMIMKYAQQIILLRKRPTSRYRIKHGYTRSWRISKLILISFSK